MAVHSEQSTKVTESLASSQVDHWFKYAKSLEKQSHEMKTKIVMIANLLDISVNTDDLLKAIYDKITTIIGPKEFRPGYQEQPYPHWNAYTGIEPLRKGDEVKIKIGSYDVITKFENQVSPSKAYCSTFESSGIVDFNSITHYRRKP